MNVQFDTTAHFTTPPPSFVAQLPTKSHADTVGCCHAPSLPETAPPSTAALFVNAQSTICARLVDAATAPPRVRDWFPTKTQFVTKRG